MKTRIYAAPAVKGLTLTPPNPTTVPFIFKSILLADHITVLGNEMSV